LFKLLFNNLFTQKRIITLFILFVLLIVFHNIMIYVNIDSLTKYNYQESLMYTESIINILRYYLFPLLFYFVFTNQKTIFTNCLSLYFNKTKVKFYILLVSALSIVIIFLLYLLAYILSIYLAGYKHINLIPILENNLIMFLNLNILNLFILLTQSYKKNIFSSLLILFIFLIVSSIENNNQIFLILCPFKLSINYIYYYLAYIGFLIYSYFVFSK
jgi:hypothetical protein